tara:strand:- start:1589 stop:2644 length:1056 start_codon:yes stop_codon:yes gene_type:complete
MQTILVTGGAGFIGSHASVLLLERGYNLLIVDSFANSSKKVIKRINYYLEKTNKHLLKNLLFFDCDVRDHEKLNDIFLNSNNDGKPIDAVIHFAGLKAVGDSVKNPLQYWEVNVSGSINLFKIMNCYDCKTIVFSSSATIYGTTNQKLFQEDTEINPSNPYGETKATIEKILKTIYQSDIENWNIANLRYFNPIGAHESGLLGEDPKGIPNNLFPYINQVAIGERKNLYIYGNDWPTVDGTGVRDYIHVMDVADGHLSALKYLSSKNGNFVNLNLGTSKGTSVIQLIKIFEKTNNCKINYEFKERRPGDIAISIADNKLATSLLNWEPKRTLNDMCRDGWRWHKNQNNINY